MSREEEDGEEEWTVDAIAVDVVAVAEQRKVTMKGEREGWGTVLLIRDCM